MEGRAMTDSGFEWPDYVIPEPPPEWQEQHPGWDKPADDTKPNGAGEHPSAAKSGRLVLLTPADCAVAKHRPYVAKGLIGEGDLALIIGQPGAGKSVLGPHMAYAVAQGRAIFGRRVRQGRVLYIAAEDGPGMRIRTRAL